jgi:putative tryptophan/tyrosine transport system substrate-binding protein
MIDRTRRFAGDIPANYDSGLGPHLFVDFGADLARRATASKSSRPYAEAGVLATYGVDVVNAFRVSVTQIGQILKGAFPSDIPVQQPTKLELVVNAKAAKSLGLTIPQSILLRADEVIE